MVLWQKRFKTRLQPETVELEFICKLDTIKIGLNRDWEWLAHYKKITILPLIFMELLH